MKPVSIMSYGVSLAAVYIVYSVLSGRKFWLLGSDKAAFYVLWVIGLGMSILAGTRDMVGDKFTLPNFLVYPLMALGIAAFVLLIMMVFGAKVSFFPSYHQAFVALAVIIGAKWLLVHSYLTTKVVAQALASLIK